MGLLTDFVYENHYILLALLIPLLFLYRPSKPDTAPSPPYVPHSIPFIGCALSFGMQPVQFLAECKAKYGDCFTFKMIGRNMTFCLGKTPYFYPTTPINRRRGKQLHLQHPSLGRLRRRCLSKTNQTGLWHRSHLRLSKPRVDGAEKVCQRSLVY